MLTKIQQKTNDKYFFNEKHFECTEPSDVIQMSILVLYLQRKKEKQSLELYLKTKETEEPYKHDWFL
jgi:hypothetical protein